MLENMNVISVILAAAVAGIGSGIGVAIGQSLYKALLEEKITKFLDKKHREEMLRKIKDIESKSVFRNGVDSESVVNKMLGKNE